MKKHLLLSSVAAITLMTIVGCSSTSENKKLDNALNAEKAPTSSADMRAHADAEIRASTVLSDEEKAKLLAIKSKLHADLEANKEESLKLRALFVKNLTSEPYDTKQVSLIKKRLKENSDLYTKTLVKSLEDAAKAIGKGTPEKSDMLNNYFGVRGSIDRRE